MISSGTEPYQTIPRQIQTTQILSKSIETQTQYMLSESTQSDFDFENNTDDGDPLNQSLTLSTLQQSQRSNSIVSEDSKVARRRKKQNTIDDGACMGNSCTQ